MTFETERLLCRPTGVEDAMFILELLNTPKWLTFIGDRNVHTLENATAYIQDKMIPQLERLGYGNYTVIEKVSNLKIGTVGLYDREGLEGVDIGFALLPAYEGKGYAFEASSKLMEAAQHTFKLSTINAITTRDNISSKALLEKLGLRFKETIKLPGNPKEFLFYSWLKNKK